MMETAPRIPGHGLASRRRLWRATFHLFLGLTLASVLLIAARVHLAPDTWWHLRTGAWIVTQRRLPTQDLWSYTRYGAAWSPPGWPVQVLFYALVRVAGYGSLNVWTAAMYALAYLFVFYASRGHPGLRAFAVALAAITGSLYQAARPYMVTTVLTAFFLWVLETWYRGQAQDRRLWWLLPGMALWTNTHAGFLSGFLLWGVYTLSAGYEAWRRPSAWKRTRFRRLLLLGLGLLAAAMLNPKGPARLLYPLATLGLRRLTWIAEWQSPDFTRPVTWPFLAWWFLLLGLLAAHGRRMHLRHLLLWLGFGALAFRAVRNVALFALIAPVCWTPYAHYAWRTWRKGRRAESKVPPVRNRLNRMLVAAAWLAVALRLLYVSLPGYVRTYIAQTYPTGAVAYLRAFRPQGRLFNSYNWGAFLLWSLPEYPVFIDGRTDLYGDAFLEAWAQVAQAEPGWEQQLARWQVNIVLMEPRWPITRVLPLAGWQEVYRDDHSVLFLRKGEP